LENRKTSDYLEINKTNLFCESKHKQQLRKPQQKRQLIAHKSILLKKIPQKKLKLQTIKSISTKPLIEGISKSSAFFSSDSYYHNYLNMTINIFGEY